MLGEITKPSLTTPCIHIYLLGVHSEIDMAKRSVTQLLELQVSFIVTGADKDKILCHALRALVEMIVS